MLLALKRLSVAAEDDCSRSRSRSSAGGTHALCIKLITLLSHMRATPN